MTFLKRVPDVDEGAVEEEDEDVAEAAEGPHTTLPLHHHQNPSNQLT
jgi:hypothetical protein